MGNCLRHESSDMAWGGEYWGSPQSEKLFTNDTRRRGDERKRDEADPEEMLQRSEEKKEKNKSGGVASGVAVKEIKIKITKKQLEELLGKVDVQGLSIQQVLAQLMIVGDRYNQAHQPSWRPALQTIPE